MVHTLVCEVDRALLIVFYTHFACFFFSFLPQPSLSILQSFMNSCHKDRAYSRLSAVVKKAKESGLQLEKIFYQRALVELRQWGQDQDAITAIYKALRKIDLNQSQKGTEETCVGVHEHVVYVRVHVDESLIPYSGYFSERVKFS